MVERRTLLASLGALSVLGPKILQAAATAATDPHAGHDMKSMGPPREIAMLMYPGFFALDLVGPFTVLASLMNTRVHLIAKTMDPIIATPAQFPITPSGTFADCPKDLELLLIPGGARSTVDALLDDATVEFVRDRGSRAKYVTSVCTGSLLLGAAGLLKGYKATSHWVTHDLLTQYGAIPTKARVVVDRNRISGGGVTAGIDFGLKVASIMEGEEIAQLIQLIIEYDPEPPFNAGSPERAPAKILERARQNYAPFRKAVTEAVERTARKLI